MQQLLQGSFAHSKPDRPPSAWQPLADHLHHVATRAADFAAPFHSEGWARAAGWLHDLGKAASAGVLSGVTGMPCPPGRVHRSLPKPREG